MNEQYVIVEFNQASHRPRLAYDDVYDERHDAVTDMDGLREENRRVGRRERYAIATLDIEDEDEE